MNLFKFGEEFWGKEWKKRGVFHYFTLSGLLSLSAKASDERVWPLAWMSLSWFPGSLIRSGHSRAVKVKVKPLSHVRLFAIPWTLQPTRLLCPWDSPGKNTGVGCHALLQGIFPTQGWNPGLLRCRWMLLPSEPPGQPQANHSDFGFQSRGISPNVPAEKVRAALLAARPFCFGDRKSSGSSHQFPQGCHLSTPHT